MGRPALEVADIFGIHGPAYREAHGHAMSGAQQRVMHAIKICRTAVLGGHVDKCDRCGHRRIRACRKTEWEVYSKPPFGGPDQVLDYLGRFTHRVAISND